MLKEEKKGCFRELLRLRIDKSNQVFQILVSVLVSMIPIISFR